MSTNNNTRNQGNGALRLLVNLPEIIAGCLLVLMSLMVVFQVFFRYVVKSPITWSEEVSTFSFIWLATLSAALGVKYQLHFSLEVVARRIPAILQRVLVVVSALAITGLLAIMVWFGFALVGMNSNQVSPALGMPMSVPYLSVPVSSALMIVYIWIDVVRKFRGEEPLIVEADPQLSSGV